jgi:hypothetical protein
MVFKLTCIFSMSTIDCKCFILEILCLLETDSQLYSIIFRNNNVCGIEIQYIQKINKYNKYNNNNSNYPGGSKLELMFLINWQSFLNFDCVLLLIILRDQFLQEWNSNLEKSPKALNYRLYKQIFEFEKYFNILENKDRECNDIIRSAKGSQISEKYWSEVGKGKRADVYLEVRRRRGYIFFEWNKCLFVFVGHIL